MVSRPLKQGLQPPSSEGIMIWAQSLVPPEPSRSAQTSEGQTPRHWEAVSHASSVLLIQLPALMNVCQIFKRCRNVSDWHQSEAFVLAEILQICQASSAVLCVFAAVLDVEDSSKVVGQLTVSLEGLEALRAIMEDQDKE